jgi:hypothetical protein
MSTTVEKLEYLNETKSVIKQAIINKGVAVDDTVPFRSYANKISSIKTDPKLQSKSTSITSNGTTTVKPDSGYEGLSSVAIITNIYTDVNHSYMSNLGATGTKQWTIPANVKKAVITFVLSHYNSGPSGGSGLPTCTATKGKLTLGYSGYDVHETITNRPWIWILENTTGTASTITLKTEWDNGSSFSHIHSYVSVAY